MTAAGARRVLVATYGSAGDLFPLMPVVLRLRRDGHDVTARLVDQITARAS